MNMDELRQLSDDELREVSLRKNRKGIYTDEANMAQSIRQERSGYWVGVPRKPNPYDIDIDDAISEVEKAVYGGKKYRRHL